MHKNVGVIHASNVIYLLSVHIYRHHANLGKDGCLSAKWSVQNESI